MNKTEIVIKLSLPAIVATGYVCYKLGQASVFIKAAKAMMDKKSEDNSED